MSKIQMQRPMGVQANLESDAELEDGLYTWDKLSIGIDKVNAYMNTEKVRDVLNVP